MKNERNKQIALSTNFIYQKDFFKAAVSICLSKEHSSAPIAFEQREVNKNGFLKQFALTANEIRSKTFEK